MPPNPPSNAHGLAMRSMSLRDMQIPKSEKKISWPPPPKSWGRPWDRHTCNMEVGGQVHVHSRGGRGGLAPPRNGKKMLSEGILISFTYVLLMKLGRFDKH